MDKVASGVKYKDLTDEEKTICRDNMTAWDYTRYSMGVDIL